VRAAELDLLQTGGFHYSGPGQKRFKYDSLLRYLSICFLPELIWTNEQKAKHQNETKKILDAMFDQKGPSSLWVVIATKKEVMAESWLANECYKKPRSVGQSG
jgi:hypothetical protein